MRLRHKSEDLQKHEKAALIRDPVKVAVFATQENGCGSLLWTAAVYF